MSKLSRREFLGRSAKMAGAAAFGGTLLASCGRNESSAGNLSYFKKSKMKWDVAKGATIHAAFVQHPFQNAISALIPEFEALTGISVQPDVLPSTQYFDKLSVNLSSRDGTPDVFMTGPYVEWPNAKAGFMEPLEKYLGDAEMTDAAWYDKEDFFPNLWKANVWNAKSVGPGEYGTGSVWAIPVQEESYILAYRKDLFKKRGIRVPETYPELYDAAKAADKHGIVGMTARGFKEWDTLLTGYATGFFSSGGRDLNARMQPVMNSPDGVKFTDGWTRCLRESGPKDITSQTWFQAEQNFMDGQAAMYLDCDFFAAQYENPKMSKVAGKVGYHLAPSAKDGIKSNLWTFALGMNGNSRQKHAAWLFIAWATSKQTLKRATVQKGNFNPTRRSVWNDPDVTRVTGKWGSYRDVVTENLNKHANILWAVSPQITTIGSMWVSHYQNAILGKETAKEALDATANEVHALLKKAGYYGG